MDRRNASLRYGLNLARNKLSGEVPWEIRKLSMLQQLDVSLNNLTGSLQVLDGLNALVGLNISYNNFSGPIPQTMMKFVNASTSSFFGNSGLCLKCVSINQCSSNKYFKPCNDKLHGGLQTWKVTMIVVGTLLGVALLFGLVFKFIIWIPLDTTLKKLMRVTRNLNDKYIIGRGGQGVVYKATFDPDNVFAAKKLTFTVDRDINNGMAREIRMLQTMRHRNVIRLENFWFKKKYGIMLFRYMANGSLYDALHKNSPPQALEWAVRYNIALGIAHALSYLHFDCVPPVIHRDIKSENILLDADMEPYVTDFGIAKTLTHSDVSSQSYMIAGTIGYMAPENVYGPLNGTESDVYSYGVVLFELITRKRALDASRVNIVTWVRSALENEEELTAIVDSTMVDELQDSNIEKQVKDLFGVAYKCTQIEPARRPIMRDVVNTLLDAKKINTRRATR